MTALSPLAPTRATGEHSGNGRQALSTSQPTQTSAAQHRQVVRDRLFVLALCLLAFGLRLHELDASSFWGDEGFTAQRIALSMREILLNQIPFDDVITQDNHPALYFVFLKLFGELAGTSEFVLKYYSVAWAVVLVPMFYSAGRLLLSARAARAAALLAALSPVYLWYAQEMRMYMQLVALSLLSVYLLARAIKRGGLQRWLALAGSVVAMCYTQYSGLMVAAFEVLVLAATGWRLRRARPVMVLVVTLLSTFPLVISNLPWVFSGPEPHKNFVELDVIARDLLNSFSLGISVRAQSVWWLDLVFLAVLLLGVLWPLVRRSPSAWPGARLLLLGYLVVPVLAYYALTYLKPAYQGVRHLIVVSPAFYLLLAEGIAVLSSRLRLAALPVVVLLVGGMLYSTDQYFNNPHYLKDDWRGLIRYVEANAWARDAVLVNNSFLQGTFDYYSKDDGLEWVTVPGMASNLTLPAEAERAAAQLEALRAKHPRIWLAVGPPQDGRDVQLVVERWLAENMTLVDDQLFHGRSINVHLRLYMAQPAVSESPYPGSSPFSAAWQHGPHVLAYILRRPERIEGGTMLPIQIVWQSQEAIEAVEHYAVHVAVVDEQGLPWATTDQPIAPLPPGTPWPVGKLVLGSYSLALPPGLPPGEYRIMLTLLSTNGESQAPVPRAGGSSEVEVVAATVSPAYTMPDPRRLPNFTPMSVNFDNGAALVGYRLDTEQVDPGQTVGVQLYWRALRDAPGATGVRLELIDWLGRVWAGGEGVLPSDGVVAEDWRASQVLATHATLRVPGQLSPGWYRLHLSLVSEHGSDLGFTGLWPFGLEKILLQDLLVGALSSGDLGLPPGTETLQAVFGERLALDGFLVEGKPAPGSGFTVTLYWRALEAPPPNSGDLVSYVHVFTPDGKVLALHDSIPAGALRPVDTWRPGEIVSDRHLLSLPADAPPGPYRVYAGLYHTASGQRWPVTLEGVPQPNDELRLPDLASEGP